MYNTLKITEKKTKMFRSGVSEYVYIWLLVRKFLYIIFL